MKKARVYDLFDEPFQLEMPSPRKDIYYVDLTIHERINVKANSAGFEKMFYLGNNPRFMAVRENDYRPERITNKWFSHYRRNCTISLQTIMWRERCIQFKLI